MFSQKDTKSFLPPPFDWCEIPTGKVKILEGGYIKEFLEVFEIPSFHMAKYPITNAQYAKFVADAGYSQRKWWTSEGWQAKEAGSVHPSLPNASTRTWTEPRGWKASHVAGDDKPVVGVSWYEAIAFCQWLSEKTSENITLPTEQQWQRAAQGDDNRNYPWGKWFDPNFCNTAVGHREANIQSKGASSVTHYEGKGDSPFGVVDMVGNVAEWCLTSFDNGNYLSGTSPGMIRGREWYHGAEYGDKISDFYVTNRLKMAPTVCGYGQGFRIARLT